MIINSEFRPSWWCKHRHLQTIFPRLRKQPSLILKHEQLDLPDGDFLDLAWTEDKPDKNTPLIILLHGLEGSVHSPYATGILKTIIDNNWQGVLMHFRGCSGRHNRLDRSYHSGETGDLQAFITILKERFPGRPLAATGISLGGNALLKYLGEQNKHCPLVAAMAVSVPFDLADGAIALNKGFARFYQRHLIKSLQKKFRDKFKNRPAPVDIDRLHEWTDFYSFDHNVTAPIHGFKSADDYYTRSSSRQFLKHISIPTYILHSKDDPFMSLKSIPNDAELSPEVTLELTNHGGHVGFIYGNSPFHAHFWIEKKLVEFFTPVFG